MAQRFSKPSICLLGCGGTLIMVRGPNGLEPKLTTKDIIAKTLKIKELARVRSKQLMNKDSTNMRPSDWTRIAETIRQLRTKHTLDALVITHGTDTMAYTAGALSLAFGRGLDFPIVLTGSQLPLDDPGTDAGFNVENAFRVARAAAELGVAEVMISFAHSVLRGCRARKRNEVHFDAFESPACEALATIDHTVRFNKDKVRTRVQAIRDAEFRPRFAKGVLHLRLTPGLSPDFVEKV